MLDSISNEARPVTPGKSYYGWVVLAICTVLVTLAYGLSLSYSVFFKPLAGQFHWDRTTTSFVYSISWLIRGLVAIAVGWASDRFGAKAILIICGVVTCIGFVASSQVHTPWQFFFTYAIVLAIGLSGSFGIGTSLVAKWFDKKSALPFGILSMSSGLGLLVVVPIAARLLVSYTLPVTFIICGVAGGLITVSGALLLRPAPKRVLRTDIVSSPGSVLASKPANEAKDVTLREALRYPELYWLMCIFFVFVFTTQIVQLNLVNYATDLGVTPLKAATFTSILAIVSIAGRLLTGLIGDRINTLNLMLIALAVTLVSFAILIFSTSLVSLYFFAVVFGIAYGAEVPLTPMMAKKYFGTKAMATLVGVFQLAGGIGGFVGPLVAGRIFDVTRSYYWVFIIGAIVVVLCAVPVLILKKGSSDAVLVSKAIPAGSGE